MLRNAHCEQRHRNDDTLGLRTQEDSMSLQTPELPEHRLAAWLIDDAGSGHRDHSAVNPVTRPLGQREGTRTLGSLPRPVENVQLSAPL